MIDAEEFPQFRPDSKGHHALDYLEAQRVVCPVGEIRNALSISKSGKARTRFAHTMAALEENGMVTRSMVADQAHYLITAAGRAALVHLNMGRDVAGLPCHERARPPKAYASARLFQRAA